MTENVLVIGGNGVETWNVTSISSGGSSCAVVLDDGQVRLSCKAEISCPVGH